MKLDLKAKIIHQVYYDYPQPSLYKMPRSRIFQINNLYVQLLVLQNIKSAPHPDASHPVHDPYASLQAVVFLQHESNTKRQVMITAF